ncbi:MAG: PASTA domain-containing protein [Actinobacteria bacterium]|nr:PASTA domain-containing protein [Actinomycetota bacterium]
MTNRWWKGLCVVCVAGATAMGAGAGSQVVPNVKGKSMAAAVKTIVAAGYYADTSPVTGRSVGRGTVSSQDPKAGSALKRGKAVRVAVSIGSPRRPDVKIPNLVGKSAADARAKLVQSRLTMATKFRKTGKAKVGKVIAQSPFAGMTFQQYAQVVILVGKL